MAPSKNRIRRLPHGDDFHVQTTALAACCPARLLQGAPAGDITRVVVRPMAITLRSIRESRLTARPLGLNTTHSSGVIFPIRNLIRSGRWRTARLGVWIRLVDRLPARTAHSQTNHIYGRLSGIQKKSEQDPLNTLLKQWILCIGATVQWRCPVRADIGRKDQLHGCRYGDRLVHLWSTSIGTSAIAKGVSDRTPRPRPYRRQREDFSNQRRRLGRAVDAAHMGAAPLVRSFRSVASHWSSGPAPFDIVYR